MVGGMTFRRHGIAALILFAAVSLHAQETLRQQIEPMIHEMEQAANAHDTDRFMAAYVHQPTLIFVINGEVIHGWSALREQQLKWWLNGKTDVVYSPSGEPEYSVLGPDTVAVTLPLASSRMQPDGTKSRGTFVVSMIWEKLPEGWRIVYAHESATR